MESSNYHPVPSVTMFFCYTLGCFLKAQLISPLMRNIPVAFLNEACNSVAISALQGFLFFLPLCLIYVVCALLVPFLLTNRGLKKKMRRWKRRRRRKRKKRGRKRRKGKEEEQEEEEEEERKEEENYWVPISTYLYHSPLIAL